MLSIQSALRTAHSNSRSPGSLNTLPHSRTIYPELSPTKKIQSPSLNALVTFGCRVLALYSDKAGYTSDRDALRGYLLSDASQSLKKQSGGNRPHPVLVREPYHLKADIWKLPNVHGWGITSYGKDPLPKKLGSSIPASEDAAFDQAVQTIKDEDPHIVLAHIRQASGFCKENALKNNHPFVHDQWSWMHNGAVEGALHPSTLKKLADNKEQYGFSPKGTTDTEHAFYLFLGNLKTRCGTTDTKKAGLAATRKVFAETMRELWISSPPTMVRLDNNEWGISKSLGITGTLNWKPIMNFVASDGENLLAFCHGVKLYLGIKDLPQGEKEYMVASEPIAPESMGIKWVELYPETVLSLSREPNGKVKVDMHSLDELAPETFTQQFVRLTRVFLASIPQQIALWLEKFSQMLHRLLTRG